MYSSSPSTRDKQIHIVSLFAFQLSFALVCQITIIDLLLFPSFIEDWNENANFLAIMKHKEVITYRSKKETITFLRVFTNARLGITKCCPCVHRDGIRHLMIVHPHRMRGTRRHLRGRPPCGDVTLLSSRTAQEDFFGRDPSPTRESSRRHSYGALAHCLLRDPKANIAASSIFRKTAFSASGLQRAFCRANAFRKS